MGLTTGDIITNDGYSAKSAEGPGATGSPQQVILSPANSVAITPNSQVEYARAGQTFTYTLAVHNLGSNPDNFALSISGNAWATTLWNASFTTPVTQTGTLSPRESSPSGSRSLCRRWPQEWPDDTATVKATSAGNPVGQRHGYRQTFAVTKLILLVDEDGQAAPATVLAIYTAALNGTGFSSHRGTWPLDPVPRSAT